MNICSVSGVRSADLDRLSYIRVLHTHTFCEPATFRALFRAAMSTRANLTVSFSVTGASRTFPICPGESGCCGAHQRARRKQPSIQSLHHITLPHRTRRRRTESRASTIFFGRRVNSIKNGGYNNAPTNRWSLFRSKKKKVHCCSVLLLY